MVDINAAIRAAQQTVMGSDGSLTASSSTIASNYDSFLSLLTTQLKNQDPTDPLDTNEFTQQLIQYTEVEQMLQSNKKLEALLQLSSANASIAVINYVGKEVTTSGDTTALVNGSAEWALDVPANADNVTFVVKDASGNEVYSTTGSLTAGNRSFSWDGRTSSGGTAEPGNYTLTVSARDAADRNIGVGLSVKGIVSGVDMTGEAPVLMVNGNRVSLGDIRQINTV